MKKPKMFLIIVLMALLWFSKDYFWYNNFKNYYKSTINSKISDIRHGKSGKEFKLTKNSDYLSLYCDNEDFIMVDDSISKKNNSDEIKIYIQNDNNWIYSQSVFIRKDLDYYSFIVNNK